MVWLAMGASTATAPRSSRHQPRVSVVLAARDEEGRIEQTLRHILAQEHVDLEVIPVSESRSGPHG
jgi:Glycosyltransferases involved in cell wall biogenesis